MNDTHTPPKKKGKIRPKLKPIVSPNEDDDEGGLGFGDWTPSKRQVHDDELSSTEDQKILFERCHASVGSGSHIRTLYPITNKKEEEQGLEQVGEMADKAISIESESNRLNGFDRPPTEIQRNFDNKLQLYENNTDSKKGNCFGDRSLKVAPQSILSGCSIRKQSMSGLLYSGLIAILCMTVVCEVVCLAIVIRFRLSHLELSSNNKTFASKKVLSSEEGNLPIPVTMIEFKGNEVSSPVEEGKQEEPKEEADVVKQPEIERSSPLEEVFTAYRIRSNDVGVVTLANDEKPDECGSLIVKKYEEPKEESELVTNNLRNKPETENILPSEEVAQTMVSAPSDEEHESDRTLIRSREKESDSDESNNLAAMIRIKVESSENGKKPESAKFLSMEVTEGNEIESAVVEGILASDKIVAYNCAPEEPESVANEQARIESYEVEMISEDSGGQSETEESNDVYEHNKNEHKLRGRTPVTQEAKREFLSKLDEFEDIFESIDVIDALIGHFVCALPRLLLKRLCGATMKFKRIFSKSFDN